MALTTTILRAFNNLAFNQSTRMFALSSVRGKNHYKVLVSGGGTGGCAVAGRLSNMIESGNLAVIEPSETHYYQAAWTLVGGGIRKLESSALPMEKAIHKKAEWIKERIVSFDPPNNRVILSSGRVITYDYLVISLGFTLRYDMIKGALEALEHDPRVCSNYSSKYVEKTFKAIQNFQKGNALFTLPNTAIKCAGAPQKIMYLFEDYLAECGRKYDAKISFFTATKTLFSAPKYSRSLEQICKKRGIEYNLRHHLIEIDHKKGLAVMENLDTNETKTYPYDLIHVTPPMTSPEVLVKTPGLTSPEAMNFVHVDPQTLRHVKFNNIFSLGDCSSLPTSKTSAAIARQNHVLCDNLVDVLNGGNGTVAKYNGYTSCPIITGYNKGIIAEFDYNLEPCESMPIDQSTERAIFAWIKKSVLPPLYWNGVIRGTFVGLHRISPRGTLFPKSK